MPDTDPDIRAQILHSIKVIRNWTIALFMGLILVSGLGLRDSVVRRTQLEHVADQTLDALCTFKADLQRRYDDTIKFIIDHPDGIQGISAADLQRSAHNLKSTIDALRGLPCGDSAPLYSAPPSD